MNTAINLAETAFRIVVQTTWQASVVAVLILSTQWVVGKRLSQGWRYALWLVLVARLLMPVSFQSPASVFNLARFKPIPAAAEPSKPVLWSQNVPQEATSGSPGQSALSTPPEPEAIAPTPSPRPTTPVESSLSSSLSRSTRTNRDWFLLTVLVWLMGVCASGLRLAWSNLRFASRLAGQSPVREEETLRIFEECALAVGLRKKVTLIQTAEVDGPAVYGLTRKRVLLPDKFNERFTAEELRYVLFHELAHIKRFDLEISWVVSILQVLHWFNPVVWFSFERMRVDRELACDALALSRLGGGKSLSYGDTIIKLLENLARPAAVPGLLGISQDKRHLKQRINMIASFKRPTAWSALTWAIVAALALIGLTDASKRGGANSATPAVQQLSGASPGPQHKPFIGLHGRIVDAEGEPVAAAKVECQGFQWPMVTDANGRFAWEGLDKSYTFTVEKFGFRHKLTPPFPPGTNEIVIRLERAIVIGGTVIDRETRKPIDEFEVYPARTVENCMKPGIDSSDPVPGRAGEFNYSFSFFPPWPDSAFYVYAKGYLPQLSRPLTLGDDGTRLSFEMVKAAPLKGNVLTPDSDSASKAEIRLWNGQLNFREIPAQYRVDTDSMGKFSLQPALGGEITVNHASGFARVSWEQFQTNRTIRLERWGHIKGQWAMPLPQTRKVWLSPIQWTGDLFFTAQPSWVNQAKVNSDGEFEFEDPVPPGEYVLGESVDLPVHFQSMHSMMILTSQRAHVVVKPGQTAIVNVAGGRPVTGRFDRGEEPTLASNHLPIIELRSRRTGRSFGFPSSDPSLSPSENLKRMQDYKEEVLNYWLSAEGQDVRRTERRFKTHSDADGNFRFDHVPAGDYILTIEPGLQSGGSMKNSQREVIVPASAESTPIELGVLKVAENEIPTEANPVSATRNKAFRLRSSGKTVAELQLFRSGDLTAIQTSGTGSSASYDLASGTWSATGEVKLILGPAEQQAVVIRADDMVIVPDNKPFPVPGTEPADLKPAEEILVQEVTMNYSAEVLGTNQVRLEFGANGVWRAGVAIMNPCELSFQGTGPKGQTGLKLTTRDNRFRVISGQMSLEAISDGHRLLAVNCDQVRIWRDF